MGVKNLVCLLVVVLLACITPTAVSYNLKNQRRPPPRNRGVLRSPPVPRSNSNPSPMFRCPPGQVFNPKTYRCSPPPLPPRRPPPRKRGKRLPSIHRRNNNPSPMFKCAPGKVFNSLTNRCSPPPRRPPPRNRGKRPSLAPRPNLNISPVAAPTPPPYYHTKSVYGGHD